YVEVALQAPPSPDYMPGPEEPEQAPPSPDYISGPEHADDEIVDEDQPYAEDASPIAQEPEYVPESNFEMHPEDDDDEDPEEDPVDYPADGATPPSHPAYRTTARISIPAPVPMPAWTDSEVVRLLAISFPPASPLSPWSLPAPQIPFPPLPSILSPPSPILAPTPPPSPIQSDLEAHPEDDDDENPEEDPVDYPTDGGDDGDDEEGLSEDDEDDDMYIKADEEEDEEHPAPADSVVIASTAADQAPSAEETEPFETDESATTPPPHPAYRMTARISIPAPLPLPAWSNLEIVRLLAMSSPPASPLSLWSSPPPRIPFPPLPPILSPPSPVPHSTSSPPLQPPSASRREDRPEVTLPPRKRLGIALGLRYEVGESSSAAAARPAVGLRADYSFVATMDREIMHDPEREVGYGITDSWDEIVDALQGAPVSTDTELGGYMREFETRVRQDTEEIYMRLDDEQTERQLLAGWLSMLFRDRRTHAYTRHLTETEARISREAWVRSTDASNLVRGEVMSLRTTVLDQMTEIMELHAADRRRQIVISELLRADHRRSIEIIELRTALQGQVTALQGQV
nr:hypothetical protein [Tanacetum cinerariifolium]